MRIRLQLSFTDTSFWKFGVINIPKHKPPNSENP